MDKDGEEYIRDGFLEVLESSAKTWCSCFWDHFFNGKDELMKHDHDDDDDDDHVWRKDPLSIFGICFWVV